MTLKARIGTAVSSLITSETGARRRRKLREWRRRLSGHPHVVHYFHDVTDPYSLLTALVLPDLADRAGVAIETHLVSPPPDWAAPERRLLDDYSRRDAAALAARLGLEVPSFAEALEPRAVQAALGRLAAALARGDFIERAAAITAGAWRGEIAEDRADGVAAALAAGDALRERLGHYLGATFFYAGEWYWGLDRLHYLESRLDDLGAVGGAPSPHFPRHRPTLPADCAGRLAGRGPDLELFFSFRSPYSYIVLPRAFALADHYGARLRLRFVLPMVTRGLPVPAAKRLYIVRDTKREAVSEGMPFGRIADPLGRPVERGLAVLAGAIGLDEGKARRFALSFLSGVFAEGVDAGTDDGLTRLIARAGLDPAMTKAAIADETWRITAEDNRRAMVGAGLWGVPSLRYDDVATWGQDRLWLIEDAMAAMARGG
ncbi:DsbA family protein [Zavarzinia compransoris]|uniref:2-hydroxychromene-2-carboxylate isomerase n=1 Tax=Zavarzinia marina TaxID=2911065 RepID=UPI001F385EE8|nr:DsbA family protein [Zavarzinia marina]MCF4166247.1 DsbA family protein [Zavarzinia marina]